MKLIEHDASEDLVSAAYVVSLLPFVDQFQSQVQLMEVLSVFQGVVNIVIGVETSIPIVIGVLF